MQESDMLKKKWLVIIYKKDMDEFGVDNNY